MENTKTVITNGFNTIQVEKSSYTYKELKKLGWYEVSEGGQKRNLTIRKHGKQLVRSLVTRQEKINSLKENIVFLQEKMGQAETQILQISLELDELKLEKEKLIKRKNEAQKILDDCSREIYKLNNKINSLKL